MRDTVDGITEFANQVIAKFNTLEWIAKASPYYENRMEAAISQGRIDVLEYIFNPPKNASFDKSTLWFDYIRLALKEGHLDVAEWFLEKTKDRYKPPFYSYADNSSFVERIISNDKTFAFIREKNLIEGLNEHVFELLLNTGVVNDALNAEFQIWWGPFSDDYMIKHLKIISKTNMTMVTWFCEKTGIELTETGFKFKNGPRIGVIFQRDAVELLYNAIKTKDLEMVKFFNVCSTVITKPHINGFLIMDTAIEKGTLEIAQWLFKNRPNDNYKFSHRSFKWAFDNSKPEIFTWLCENHLSGMFSAWTVELEEDCTNDQKQIGAYLQGKKLVLL